MSGQRYFECLLLDLDGTLVDSRNLIVSSVKFAAKQSGKRTPSSHDIMQQYGVSTSPTKILRRFRIRDTEAYWDHYLRNIIKLRLFDTRIRKKLGRISRTGVELGLITSLPKYVVDAILSHFRLSRIFSVVKTYRRGAPKWRLIDLAIRALRVEPERTMYLGDMAGDVMAAKDANNGWGIWSGLAHWSRKKSEDFEGVQPDLIFRNFGEVVTLVTKRVRPELNWFEPSQECYTPHPRYLPRDLRIGRQSCRYCFFPADCLNCTRFTGVTELSPKKSEVRKLSKQIGVPLSSSEWYYPRNYPRHMIDDEDSIDTSNMVRAFKKGDGAHYFRFRLGLSMAKHLEQLQASSPAYRNVDIIIPIPSTKKKIVQRGYNPPEELAKVLSKLTGIPLASNCLRTKAKRSRHVTRYEYEWEADKDRLMRNIHLRNMAVIAGKKVLLLDDILTDGVTLSAYAEKIKQKVRPAPRVVALTFGLTKKGR